ncbi:hypothetical protein A374_07839 [Fictibacillus macauensis ZFHKF-1]|uniref:Uncharacterized protein n=1 Tax=Fictibacillus macauensis ZFHKF-1 TaxID=1196324 RepID=I8AJM0_9BACL|nr:hypothetical protein [Fictibacillus macauensis]EIT85729.1 hypothetical protein A374_07839 [Fictibacillus macauensis ZFHKF-1]
MKNNIIHFPVKLSTEDALASEVDLIEEIRGLLREFQNDYSNLIKRAILTRIDLLTKLLVSRS